MELEMGTQLDAKYIQKAVISDPRRYLQQQHREFKKRRSFVRLRGLINIAVSDFQIPLTHLG